MKTQEILNSLKTVLDAEARALQGALKFLDDSYVKAVEIIHASQNKGGKLIISGVGKSGLVARKTASTMSSTGTLALYLHPTEAMHGDLGIVTDKDVVLFMGKSGESEEILDLFPALRKIGCQVIALTGHRGSTLAKISDLVLIAEVDKEACPHDLAPTSSTTLFIALGDALAITLMKLRDFKPQDFALYHPGGKLGRRLLLKVEDLLIPLSGSPLLDPKKAKIDEVIAALGNFGLVLFSTDHKTLAGILTDGDVRRALNQHKAKIFEVPLEQLIIKKPITIQKGMLAMDALEFMEGRDRPLNVVPVLEGDKILGVLRLHELLRTV